MSDWFGIRSLIYGVGNKMTRTVPDEMFLLAFDEAIEQVCKRLSSSGMADEAIWAGFRKATIEMGRFALDVEDERLARSILKTDVRKRRSAAGSRGKFQAISRSRLGGRKSTR